MQVWVETLVGITLVVVVGAVQVPALITDAGSRLGLGLCVHLSGPLGHLTGSVRVTCVTGARVGAALVTGVGGVRVGFLTAGGCGGGGGGVPVPDLHHDGLTGAGENADCLLV